MKTRIIGNLINKVGKWSMSTLVFLLLSICLGTAFAADNKLKVGFVYFGAPGDHGWTYAHDQARLSLQKILGNNVITSYVKNVPEGPAAEKTIAKLAESGHKLIFTTSLGYMKPTLNVAKRFPNVYFEIVTANKRSINVSTYSARFYEGRYVEGVIAGKISKTGIVGYIASFPVPEVIRGINAFMLGAQSQNPTIKLKIAWVNTWYDPKKEAAAANTLISQGADILAQHTDSTAALEIAEKRGIHGFGQASDMFELAPNAQLTAIIDNWTPYYVSKTVDVLLGKWKSTDTWSGMKEGMVSMAPYTNMSSDVMKLARQTVRSIRSGDLHPFSGPVYDQSGTLRVAAGKTPSDNPDLTTILDSTSKCNFL